MDFEGIFLNTSNIFHVQLFLQVRRKSARRSYLVQSKHVILLFDMSVTFDKTTIKYMSSLTFLDRTCGNVHIRDTAGP